MKHNELIPFGVTPLVQLPKTFEVDAESIEQRDLLVIKSKGLKPIVDARTNELAIATGIEIRKAVKAVEELRKKVKEPYLAAGKLIDTLASDFIAPLIAEQTRLESQAAQFRREENERVRKEQEKQAAEAKRLSDEALELQRKADEAALKVKGAKTLDKAMEAQQVATAAKEQFMTVASAPAPELVKPKGTSFRQKQCFEVVDIKAVYAANPMLCKPLEISPAAVKAVCIAAKGSTKDKPDTSVVGLKLWYEDDLSFSAR